MLSIRYGQWSDLSGNGYQIAPERTVTRNGTTYQQNTANIGASSKAARSPSDVRRRAATLADNLPAGFLTPDAQAFTRRRVSAL